MAQQRRSRSTEAFFGRRAGKPLRPKQSAAMADRLPVLKLDFSKTAPADLTTLFAAPVDSVTLEIGFGSGEHLLHQMATHKQQGFIGVEPFINGMAKFVTALTGQEKNIRLHDDDATQLLDWLPESSVGSVDLLYPDPWPKQRHWKRRFVKPANLDRFARVLVPGGRFRFASDIAHYVNWTLIHCRAHAAFDWLACNASDWREPFAGWPGTRYEAKALREGRTPAYLTFVRNYAAVKTG